MQVHFGASAARPSACALTIGNFDGVHRGHQAMLACLRERASARGLPTLTRPESMIMIHVIQEMVRPSEIARSLGLTRQAVHRTIGQICEKGLFELRPDPDDGRGSIIVLTKRGEEMRHDAQHIVGAIHKVLEQRLGSKAFRELVKLLESDWGPVPEIDPAE